MKHPDGRTEDVRVVSGDTTTLGMRHRDGAVCSGLPNIPTAQTCSCVVGILALEFLCQEEGNYLIGLGTFLYGIG